MPSIPLPQQHDGFILERARRQGLPGLQPAAAHWRAPREDEGLRREGLDDLPAGLCEQAPARGRGDHARGRRRPGARALGQRAAQARPARLRQPAAASRPAAPARSRRRAPQARARSPRASRRPRSSTASSAGPTGATRPRRRGKKNAPAKPSPGTLRSAGSTTATSSRTRACACSLTRATRTRRPAPWRGAASQATTSPIATRKRRSSTRAKTTLVDNGTRAK